MDLRLKGKWGKLRKIETKARLSFYWRKFMIRVIKSLKHIWNFLIYLCKFLVKIFGIFVRLPFHLGKKNKFLAFVAAENSEIKIN